MVRRRGHLGIKRSLRVEPLSPFEIRRTVMAEVKITFDAADDYERFMGRWSRAVGEKFLTWLAPPTGARWLDVGCGTGAFSELIQRRCAPSRIDAIDPSQAQIEYGQKLLPDVRFQAADSMDLPFGDGEFDVVASALVIHFIPDRARAFAEMRRVLRPGGTLAGYTWKRTATADFAAYVPMLLGVESVGGQALRSPIVPEGSADGMRASLQAAGCEDISVTEIEVSQSFKDFDEYWEVQTLPFSPPGKSVAKLDDEQRARLRDHMRKTLPTASDGTITYSATALAGKAKRPL
jgi:SAM-dependent methyltransferase